MSKLDYRYQAIDFTGKLIATGKSISDIQGAGERILIDYKDKRFAVQGFYPIYRQLWNYTGLRNISKLLHKIKIYNPNQA